MSPRNALSIDTSIGPFENTRPTSFCIIFAVHRYFLGVTSYLGIQDLVSRMLETKRSHASDPQDDRPFSGGPGETPVLHSNNVWRWGVDRYMCVQSVIHLYG